MKWSTLSAFACVWLLQLNPTAAAAPQGEWPLGLGTLDSVPRRYPPMEENAAAARLRPLADSLGVKFTPSGNRRPSAIGGQMYEYLAAQIVRPDDRVDPLPKNVDAFLRANEEQLNAVRELLVRLPVVWPMHIEIGARAPLPNLRAHVELTRMFVVRAVARSSWDDLRAATALQRAISRRPELISQLVAISGMRMIVAAARKLPAPVPQWTEELTSFDPRRNVIASIQAEAWSMRLEMQEKASGGSVRDWLEETIVKPFDAVLAGDYHDRLRGAAAELAASSQCAFDGVAFDRRMHSEMPFWNVVARSSTPNLGLMWQRIARFNAEREATRIVLALKAGGTPQLKSSCSDGSWMLSRDASGAQHVRFSRSISIPGRRPQAAVPLEYAVGARTSLPATALPQVPR